jgi:hypothetical protein
VKKNKLNLVKRLNTKSWIELHKVGSDILHAGESAIPELIDAYDKVRFWQGRKTILFGLGTYGGTHKEVYQLGLKALKKDRSSIVREEANVLLTRADSQKAIERFDAKGDVRYKWPFSK